MKRYIYIFLIFIVFSGCRPVLNPDDDFFITSPGYDFSKIFETFWRGMDRNYLFWSEEPRLQARIIISSWIWIAKAAGITTITMTMMKKQNSTRTGTPALTEACWRVSVFNMPYRLVHFLSKAGIITVLPICSRITDTTCCQK